METILPVLIFIAGLPGLIILGLRASLYFYTHGALRLATSWRS
jgi:hypothetical protein